MYDLSTLIDRRQVLKLAGLTTISAGLMSIVGCAPSAGGSSSPASSAAGTSSATSGSAAAAADCAVIPEETAGPFPGDGSNGPNVLAQSGIVRADIRSSFGTSTTTAKGVPLTIKLTMQDATDNCSPMAGPRSISGTAIRPATTRCIRRPPPARTTCVASRRPMARES